MVQLEHDLAEIRDICKLYPLQDIFNMDETALNYKASPESSLIWLYLAWRSDQAAILGIGHVKTLGVKITLLAVKFV
jgi:hypothetical protein